MMAVCFVASFNTNFETLEDYETYNIEITNSGGFNAKLLNVVEPTSTNSDIIIRQK